MGTLVHIEAELWMRLLLLIDLKLSPRIRKGSATIWVGIVKKLND